MCSAFEIAVAGKNCSHAEVPGANFLFDVSRKLSGPAGTGHAAKTCYLKSETVEIVLQTGFCKVSGNNARSWRKGGFYFGGDRQSRRYGISSNEPGSNHQRRV
ncbi:hypothetical protein FIV06_30720 (plasmid) [Labrenzia sp. THAF191b]|nr:hypothetical protein FIV06_30720 [Labrenzia sp. THAF191b]